MHYRALYSYSVFLTSTISVVILLYLPVVISVHLLKLFL